MANCVIKIKIYFIYFDGSSLLAHPVFPDSGDDFGHCLVQESGDHGLVASARSVSGLDCRLLYGLFVSWVELQKG